LLTTKSGGGLTFQEMVMRATNGDLNFPAEKFNCKTASCDSQHEHTWDDAVVHVNADQCTTVDNRNEQAACSSFG